MPLPALLGYAFFFFLIGACVGSFLNVVIWRLPHRGREVAFLGKRGRMTLSWPPSHCPMCDSPIAWYQNIPVLSYVSLRGKCARCGAGIPIRYPLVELGTAMLWVGLFLAYFFGGWAHGGFAWDKDLNGHLLPGLSYYPSDWPVYVVDALFASALLAGSAIDADLFIIPLSICWFLGILGIGAAGFLGPPAMGKAFAIVPTLGRATWWMSKPVAGATVGLLLANVLMVLKVLPRSFASLDGADGGDKQATHAERGLADSGAQGGKKQRGDGKGEEVAGDDEPLAPPPRLTKYWPAVLAVLLLVALVIGMWGFASRAAAAMVTICAAILIFLIGVLPRDEGQVDVTEEVMEEICDPHVPREMMKELAFFVIPIVCGAAAYVVPGELPKVAWLARILGALLGFLVGGGIVWMFRIGGSLAFGREAMGMGDAHLMAGVGAVLGAPLVIVAFLIAPFLGILWAMVLKIMGKPNVLPYGPWLSVASIVALVAGNELIAGYLRLFT